MTPEDSRFPYTYAADYLRAATDSSRINRADMSIIMVLIANALGHKSSHQIALAVAEQAIKEYEFNNT